MTDCTKTEQPVHFFKNYELKNLVIREAFKELDKLAQTLHSPTFKENLNDFVEWYLKSNVYNITSLQAELEDRYKDITDILSSDEVINLERKVETLQERVDSLEDTLEEVHLITSHP